MSLRSLTAYAEAMDAGRQQWEDPVFVAQQVKLLREGVPEPFGISSG